MNVMNLLKPKKTVASVLSGFSQIVSDLYDIKDDSVERANRCRDEIDRLHDEEQGHFKEAARANGIASKISKLLDGD